MTPWYQRARFYIEKPFPWLLSTIVLVTFTVTFVAVVVVGRLVFT